MLRADQQTITNGEFKRQESQFRDFVTSDGTSRFPAEAGRYHIYASYACPWAHRTLILRKLKRLEDVISVSIVEPVIEDKGWEFSALWPDHSEQRSDLRSIYQMARKDYAGKVTVPVLWDRKEKTIVNNESSEIIRMLNRAFDAYSPVTYDFYPDDLREEIDAINAVIYEKVNNGVYRAGFAESQEAYNSAFLELFDTLDDLEHRLGRQTYLVGERQTEADWRLFTTLIRFDAVYHNHFKCNHKKLAEYEHLSAYLQRLYAEPGVAETVRLDQIKLHYYKSHKQLNPLGIVPRGPWLLWDSRLGPQPIDGLG